MGLWNTNGITEVSTLTPSGLAFISLYCHWLWVTSGLRGASNQAFTDEVVPISWGQFPGEKNSCELLVAHSNWGMDAMASKGDLSGANASAIKCFAKPSNFSGNRDHVCLIFYSSDEQVHNYSLNMCWVNESQGSISIWDLCEIRNCEHL